MTMDMSCRHGNKLGLLLFLTTLCLYIGCSSQQLCTAIANAGNQCRFNGIDTGVCCVNQAICHPVTDLCVCPIGKTGPLCDTNCLLTSDGNDCETYCGDNDCYDDNKCFLGVGNTRCICHPLYGGPDCDRCIVGNKGSHCDIACPVASDGVSCERHCYQNECSVYYGSCIQIDEGCLCREGAKGPNCEVACPVDSITRNCQISCQDNQCFSYGTCKETGTGCQCLPGHYGPYCERTCLDPNWTGLDCTIACPLVSDGHSCETDCRRNSCHDSNSCQPTEGGCHCLPGYSGSSCQYCIPTVASGQCREFCEYRGYACEAGSTCVITTGECLCPEGQIGTTCYYCQSDIHVDGCKKYCPSGCYGANNLCNIRTSQCECVSGFTGANCGMCDPSTHSYQCQGFCGSLCPVGTLCNIDSRKCTCEVGFVDPDCSYCRPSDHPQRCWNECSYACEEGDCNISTRECICYEGFSGPDCSLCEPKEVNNYCHKYCDVMCKNDGLCDVFDGTCYCLNSLYSGMDCSLCNKTIEEGDCEQQCGHGCMNEGRCNTSSLACECLPGYVLGDCSWCNPQTEDNRCVQHCGVECLNAGYCDTLTNTCECPRNFTGSDCSLCIPQFHEQQCVNYCGLECQSMATCDTASGSCICPPGFNGSDCSEKCEECRVPLCDIATEDCEDTTSFPISTMGSSNTSPHGKQSSSNTPTLLIGIGSAVGVVLILILILLLVSVLWKRKNKKERPVLSSVSGEHVPMVAGQENRSQPKYDNTYSQANPITSMASHGVTDGSGSQQEAEYYDSVGNKSLSSKTPEDNDGMYAYASTEEVNQRWSGAADKEASDSLLYAYASPDPGTTPSTARTPHDNDNDAAQDKAYNRLDFSGKPKSTVPTAVDAEYNMLGIGSNPSTIGAGPTPHPKPSRVCVTNYEEPTELLPTPSTDDTIHSGHMPGYARVNKGQRSNDPGSKGPVSPLTLKDNTMESGPGPLSPRYTIVEPDLSASDPEDGSEDQVRPSRSSTGLPLYEEANSIASKPLMPPYAKVNKKKKKTPPENVVTKPDIYDKLERPLGNFTIEEDKPKPAEDHSGEYSHLMNQPPVKQGYSKLEYGSPPSNNGSRPRLLSGNVYSELQVPQENE